MKIQLASDLHLEDLSPEIRQRVPTLITPAPGADLLVLAGDIHEGRAGIDAFADWPVPVLYIPGNHEFYDWELEAAIQEMKRASQGTSITILEKEGVVIDDLRFLGTTLWSDFQINPGVPIEWSLFVADSKVPDFQKIKTRTGLFRARNARDEHLIARRWLTAELEKPFSGKTVVVTHHASHPLSVADRFVGDLLTGAFVSDLSPLIPKANLWLHGHTHDSFNYQVGRTTVVCNPAGYILNRNAVSAGQVPRIENEAFDPLLVIEI